MNPANKQFLDLNRWAQESYSQESPPRKMGMRDRKTLLRIVQEEFDKGATVDQWCEICVVPFILNAYAMYDQYLKNEKK